MANVLTSVAPLLYSTGRVVPREDIGLMRCVDMDFDDKGVAVGDTVRVLVSPTQTAASVTPGATFASGTDRTFTNKILTLNQYKGTSWNLTGEQERSLLNGGDNAVQAFKQSVSQGFRAIANGIENYLGTTIAAQASRAFGTAGTTPFASNFNDIAQLKKIFDDNGASQLDRALVINTAAGVNLRSLTTLNQQYAAGTDSLLRQGNLISLFGFDVYESNGIASITKGTGTSYTSDTAGYAVGATVITLITGSGTVVAGDVVTFAGDTNKYVVASGVAAPGAITLQEPGLRQALAASAVAMTIGNNFTANIALQKQAVKCVVRPALQPVGPIVEQMVITDEFSGMPALLMRVVQDSQASWFMRTVYDCFVPNPYATALELG